MNTKIYSSGISGITIVLVLGIVLMLGVFLYFGAREQEELLGEDDYNMDSDEIHMEDDSSTIGEGREKIIKLLEQGSSNEQGIAVFQEVGEGVLVTVNITGAPGGTIQPMHVHGGTCEDLGDILYSLDSLVAGFSETLLEISFDKVLAGLPRSINVHKSNEELQVYVACGTIHSEESSMIEIGAEDNVIDLPVENESDNSSEVFTVTGKNYEFSRKEIRVKRGDLVRINFSSTEGIHDFRIEGLNVGTEQVSSGQSTSVEFTADTKGLFEYYCSVGDHRQLGMTGILIVE
jgi:plastocyanin